jgi:hypothetical protein
MATTAMLIASAISAGGVTAVLANKLRAIRGTPGNTKVSVESANQNQKEEPWEKQRTSK